MYCIRCGNQNVDMAQFCTNCGSPLNSATTSTVPVPVSQVVNPKKGFEVGKLFIILLYILLGLVVAGGIGAGLSGGNKESIFRVIINWLLGVGFGISVLGLLGGVIAGIVFIIKGSENSADSSYYNRNAIWCFVGPILLIIGIILGYVIINVIGNLVSPPPIVN